MTMRPSAVFRWVAFIPLAWVAGLAVYALALRMLYNETLREIGPVAAYSLAGYAICVPILYLPGLLLLRWLLGEWRPRALFPFAGMLLGAAAVCLFVGVFGYSPNDLFTPETLLFLCLFVAAGAVLGAGAALGRARH